MKFFKHTGTHKQTLNLIFYDWLISNTSSTLSTLISIYFLTVRTNRDFTVSKRKIAEFANSIDLDEVAHYEPPHLDVHCLHCSLNSRFV